jgi:hypothetical protein
LSIVAALSLCQLSMAQLELPPNGDNQRSEVAQYMGLVKVTVVYSSPRVRGREIWGDLVPYGSTNFNVGKSTEENPSPWRAGANENTIITFSHDVQVEGKALAAGTYGLHMIPGKEEWLIIFSKNSNSWGSYFYTPGEDALRVSVKPRNSDFNEWLTYEFTDRLQNSSTMLMSWERLSVPIVITVPDGDEIYFQRISEQFQGAMGPQGHQFAVWQNWVQAANFCASRKIHLDEAMSWLDIYFRRGARYYSLLQAKSNLLVAMGKQAEADAVMKEAVTLSDAGPNQLAAYGKELLRRGLNKEAMEVFLLNRDRYPHHVSALMGLAVGYSANGDVKRALKFALEALDLETNKTQRAQIESAIEQLKEGKRIN